ncbi:MAG: hypothetical protein M3Q65_11210 [Chloroflexota bacterium]|nr:hypothetical protein [Chloroflexota bacterium]
MSTATQNSLGKALLFLEQLEQANIRYRLEHVRDSLMVVAVVPGQRWEIEFFEDGHVEVERFLSSGEIQGEEILQSLIVEHGDA